MLVCISCAEMGQAKSGGVYATDTTLFRICTTYGKEMRDYRHDELVSYMSSGNLKVENLSMHGGKIKGNGISIKRLYTEGIDKCFIVRMFKDSSNKPVNYDVIYQSGACRNLSYDDVKQLAQSDRVVNATLVDNETVRLIGANCVSTLDYVNENNRGNKQASAVQSTQTSRVQSSQSNQGIQGVTSADQQDVQDTYMEILFEDALKLIKKYGFKLAYTKTYRGEVAGQQTDCILAVYCRSEGAYLVINTDTAASPRYLNGPGGKMVLLGTSDSYAGVEKLHSRYGNVRAYQVVDTSQGVFQAYTEFYRKFKPGISIVDNMGRIPSDMGIRPLNVDYQEAVLRDKYFEMADGIGENYSTYMFLMSEYPKFGPELKNIFKGVHAKAPELLAFVIAEDIVNNLNRRMIKTSLQSYVKELSKEFTGDVRVDWGLVGKRVEMLKANRGINGHGERTLRSAFSGLMRKFKRG